MKSSQLALIDGSALTEHDVMDAMHGVIVELHQTGDIEKTMHVLDVMDRIENTSGHAKAKLLWGMNEWWKETNQSNIHEMEFTDYVEQANKRNKKVTIDRYLTVQSCIEDLSIPKEFHTRPMRELVPIAKAIQQGYDIPKAVWNKLKIATGQSEIGAIIREDVKEKPLRKNARQLVLERDGSIVLWKKNTRKHLGYLAVDDVDTDVQEAIEFIIDGRIRRK